MKINVEIDRISIRVEGGEEQWYTLEEARELQDRLNIILYSSSVPRIPWKRSSDYH